jgi:hypothetical protein
MGDLTSQRWIVAKGLLFFGIVLLTAGFLFLQLKTLQSAALIALLIWSSARSSYFLFYVLERYVDPTLRYAGVLDLLRTIWSRRG